MRIAPICATVGLLLCIVACGSNTSSSTGSSGGATSAGAGRIRLQGTGSTFDAPLFSKVFDAFQKQTGSEVNYPPADQSCTCRLRWGRWRSGTTCPSTT